MKELSGKTNVKRSRRTTPKKLFKRKEDDVEIQKSNILLLGPTGSGKTLSYLLPMFEKIDSTKYNEIDSILGLVINSSYSILQADPIHPSF